VSKKHDSQFVTMVSIVIGGLIGLAIGLFALARDIGSHTAGGRLDDPEYVREVQERIAPIGKLAIAGRDNSALAIVGTAEAAPVHATAVSTTVLSGADVYKSTCSVCHATGVGGAPKYGDHAAWAPRLAQGPAALHQHALAGLTGKAGVMPAKGGRADLADQSVINAVDYIAAAAK
jgi:cytochrome c5